jgi:hypothetical protein
MSLKRGESAWNRLGDIHGCRISETRIAGEVLFEIFPAVTQGRSENITLSLRHSVSA